MLHAFGLTKDDFMETMAEFQFEPMMKRQKGENNMYKGVDTATK